MKYCKNCGNQLDDMAVICPKCGVQQEVVKTTEGDSNSWGWFVLGFCCPLVGLILYCIWTSSRPNAAKKAGLGALIATILGILVVIAIIQELREQYPYYYLFKRASQW
ncbi:MAG: zinc ribbon domain-containing protein [Lachnospiraceae bacterium]|nr:zinc ribbon domain-containing protein [Lachnospiraceae bacterium]